MNEFKPSLILHTRKIRNSSPDRRQFFCPGCKCAHEIDVNIWAFNGNYELPTIMPSIKVTHHHCGKETICHSFVTDGKIRFLNDSFHELAGQTVDLPEI